MDAATYKVVYVDRRVSQEKDLHRDDPLPIVASATINKDSQFFADDEEAITNLQAILSVFTAGGYTCRPANPPPITADSC